MQSTEESDSLRLECPVSVPKDAENTQDNAIVNIIEMESREENKPLPLPEIVEPKTPDESSSAQQSSQVTIALPAENVEQQKDELVAETETDSKEVVRLQRAIIRKDPSCSWGSQKVLRSLRHHKISGHQ